MSAQTPNAPEDRASSGIPGLDDILGGTGFPRNQMYLVEGNPGAGKTTLGLHFLMEGVRRGEKVQPEDRRQALAAGFDHPLAKPVNADDLAVLLRDCARARR